MTAPSSLDRTFHPRSVAIFGASSDPNRISGRSLHYMRRAGYAGAIYPINPRRDEVQGLRAYPSLDMLPETPDIALIVLGAGLVEDAVRQCVARGVGTAVLHTAGFAEVGAEGHAAQERLVGIARAGGLRLLGPNCIGLLHARSGFIGTFSSAFDDGVPKDGSVAIASQSGAYGGHLAYLCAERGIGVNYWISTGNEADIDVAEVIEWLARQDDVSVIMAYAEGVRDGAAFRRALATAQAQRKPIVFMKVGGSGAGAIAAQSHTASLAGSDAIYDAVFRQYGVHRARTTEEHVDIAYACARGVYPRGDRLGIVTVSGGFGIQLCDAAERAGLRVPPMPATAQAKLKAINPMGGTSNPCDTTANFLNDMSLIERTLATLYAEGDYDSIVGSFTVLPGSPTFGDPLRAAISAGTRGFADRPTALCMAAPAATVRSYDAAGFLVFPDSERAVVALAALDRFRRGFDAARPAPPVDSALRRELGARAFSEAEAQAVLAAAGIPFLPTRAVDDATAARTAAAQLGFPVVMKILSADILHKTEIGGVVLNVMDADAAAAAYDLLRARAAEHAPAARIDGVLIAPMAPKGIETIVGVARDPVFGPVVMFGLGGVYAELFMDVAFRAAPFDRDTALAMIGETRAHTLLNGFRGAPPADIAALADMLVALSAFAAANVDTIDTIDLNPLLVLEAGHGLVALDAVLIPQVPHGD